MFVTLLIVALFYCIAYFNLLLIMQHMRYEHKHIIVYTYPRLWRY